MKIVEKGKAQLPNENNKTTEVSVSEKWEWMQLICFG